MKVAADGAGPAIAAIQMHSLLALAAAVAARTKRQVG